MRMGSVDTVLGRLCLYCALGPAMHSHGGHAAWFPVSQSAVKLECTSSSQDTSAMMCLNTP